MRDGLNNWKWGIFLLVHTFIKYGASFEKEKTPLRALIGCKRGKSGRGWITFYQESDAAAVKEGINSGSQAGKLHQFLGGTLEVAEGISFVNVTFSVNWKHEYWSYDDSNKLSPKTCRWLIYDIAYLARHSFWGFNCVPRW